jgi:hypothetical protein
LRIKRKDHIRDVLVNHGIYHFKNSLNLVKLKSKFILTIEFGLGLEKSSIDGSAIIEQKVAGGLVGARGRSSGQRLRRAVRAAAHTPKLKILVIRVLYIHTGISLLHLRPACEGVTGRHRAEQGVASFEYSF